MLSKGNLIKNNIKRVSNLVLMVIYNSLKGEPGLLIVIALALKQYFIPINIKNNTTTIQKLSFLLVPSAMSPWKNI